MPRQIKIFVIPAILVVATSYFTFVYQVQKITDSEQEQKNLQKNSIVLPKDKITFAVSAKPPTKPFIISELKGPRDITRVWSKEESSDDIVGK